MDGLGQCKPLVLLQLQKLRHDITHRQGREMPHDFLHKTDLVCKVEKNQGHVLKFRFCDVEHTYLAP